MSERSTALGLLKDFHSRDMQREVSRSWEQLLAGTSFYMVGEADITDYYSDKDDPETRAPWKRAKDPDGVQGVWKYFTHKHSGDVGFYTTKANYARIYPQLYGAPKLYPQLPTAVLRVDDWPGTMTMLSVLAEVTLNLPTGKRKVFTPASVRLEVDRARKGELELWAYPDTHTLVAWRSPNDYTTPGDEIYLWRGGSLHVTKHGIQG